MKKVSVCIFVLILLGLARTLCQVPSYKIVDLGAMLPNSTTSTAWAVNDFGWIVGESDQGAFVWHDGQMMILGEAGSRAYDISDNGLIVGKASDGTGFVWRSGQTRFITSGTNIRLYRVNEDGLIIGELEDEAEVDRPFVANFQSPDELISPSGIDFIRGLNSQGQAVGWSYDSDLNLCQAVSWEQGISTKIESSSSDNSVAMALNDDGMIVGASTTNSALVMHACLWSNGEKALLDTSSPPLSRSCASDINSLGQVVGVSEIYGATLWQNDQMINLSNCISKDWSLRNAYHINDNGWIVGDGFKDGIQQCRAFALIPTAPEPASLIATLALLTAYLINRQRIR